MPESERAIQTAILLDLGRDPRLRLWRMNTGVAFAADGHPVRFGVPGQADITGILADGRRLEIEVKSATGRPTKHQENYRRMIESMGGVYILARSVEDARGGIDRALPLRDRAQPFRSDAHAGGGGMG